MGITQMKTEKTIISFETGRSFDRTKEPHTIGNYDIDFWKTGTWYYAATKKTIEEAKIGAKWIMETAGAKKTRIIKSTTGELLWVS